MRFFRRLAALVIGFVFFMAGFLKLQDPVGAGLVVEEYYKFLHLGFLSFSANFVGTALALFETLLGAALITGVWRKTVALASLIVLFFFTGLTLVLLIANPNMDCGCFGEAIHLTHFQSFLKNVVLCLLWIAAFVPFKNLQGTAKINYVGFGVTAVSVCLFCLVSVLSIPMLDFTPYAPGTEIQGSDGYYSDQAQFLSFCDATGSYVDEMAVEGNVLVLSVHTPQRLSKRQWTRLENLVSGAERTGYTPLLLLGCSPEGFDFPDGESQLAGYAYFADRRTLMTLNRSNGGSTFISDGQIVAKWAALSPPGEALLSELGGMDSTEALIAQSSPRKIKAQAFLLYVFAVMLLL